MRITYKKLPLEPSRYAVHVDGKPAQVVVQKRASLGAGIYWCAESTENKCACRVTRELAVLALIGPDAHLEPFAKDETTKAIEATQQGTEESVRAAFRQACFLKLQYWDAVAALDLETGSDDGEDLVSTACACLGEPEEALSLTDEEVDQFMGVEDDEAGDDLCDRCGRSGVAVSRTDESGTVCVSCEREEAKSK